MRNNVARCERFLAGFSRPSPTRFRAEPTGAAAAKLGANTAQSGASRHPKQLGLAAQLEWLLLLPSEPKRAARYATARYNSTKLARAGSVIHLSERGIARSKEL